MGQIWVKEFSGGLDSRRMPETTLGGALLRATDCYINRGGEIEQRPAFVDFAALPTGTVGLAFDDDGLVVFGSAAAPAGMPAGVRYQRLQHPENASAVLTAVPSFDRAEKRLYVVGEFSDGTRVHFYDGVAVEWPFDGRARASILVSSGGFFGGTAADTTFTVGLATFSAPPYTIDTCQIDGVDVIGAQIVSNDSTAAGLAAAIAASINSATSAPDYVAESSGADVTIRAAIAGSEANGKTVVFGGVDADITMPTIDPLADGVDGIPAKLTNMTVNDVGVLNGPVEWSTDTTKMAEDIAASINAKTSTTNISAQALDARVTLRFEPKGASNNGKVIVTTVTSPLVITPASGVVFSGGLDAADIVQPGRYVRSIISKVHSVAGTFLEFSGLNQPTRHSTDVAGAGFIDFARESSLTEDLRAIAPFQQYAAIFDESVIFIWFLDPDPTLNRKSQVLENTGAVAPRSVTQYGDSELFYLDSSGVRSLRARASNSNASTNDIGVPVDTLIQAKLDTLTADQKLRCYGLINPRDGQFWLTMRDEIYVFTAFSGSKIAAWSKYLPTVDVDGVQTLRPIDEAISFRRKLYFRSGDKIIVFGGPGDTPVYDTVSPDVWLPYLDGAAPALPKRMMAIDAACEGEWRVSVGADPTDIAVEDPPAVLFRTTFPAASVPYEVAGTHFSVRLRGAPGEPGPRKVGALIIHYAADAEPEQK